MDWINNLIYWTDSKLNRVEVATLDGRKRSVLRKTRNTPQDIVVDPINRYGYDGELERRNGGREGGRENAHVQRVMESGV